MVSGGVNSSTFSALPGRMSPILQYSSAPAANTSSSAAARANAPNLSIIVEDDDNNPNGPTPSAPRSNSATAGLTSKAALAEVYSSLKRRADQAVRDDPKLEDWVRAQAAKYQ